MPRVGEAPPQGVRVCRPRQGGIQRAGAQPVGFSVVPELARRLVDAIEYAYSPERRESRIMFRKTVGGRAG